MRTCSHCGMFPMMEGYCIEQGCEYYCSDECLHANMSQEDYEQLYDNGNGDSFWTEWEDEGIYSDDALCACCNEELTEGYYIPHGSKVYTEAPDMSPIYVCDTSCLRKAKLGVYNKVMVPFVAEF